jgi:hypothetical protein
LASIPGAELASIGCKEDDNRTLIQPSCNQTLLKEAVFCGGRDEIWIEDALE